MGTTADKLNKILASKAAIKAAIEAKGVENVGDILSAYPDKIAGIQSGGGEPDDYALQSQKLILPVETTIITTRDGKTAAVTTNDHIKIVDEDMKAYTVKQWNDRSVANNFNNSLVSKPIGFLLECNTVKTLIRWPFVGKIWGCTGAASTDNAMHHSMFEYDQRTGAASGTDYHGTADEQLGTNTAGSHHAADWSVTDGGDSLTLHSGNTGQSWTMAKGCGNSNFLVAFNYKERNDAMYVQNEWMRHRFAICSGIQTTQPAGTIGEIEILNASGTQAAEGEDMYFWIEGQNTGLKARYNLNNKYATNNAYYLTEAVAEFIYEKQKAAGINMNDTGVNSAGKHLLVPGAKGAEAISVDGFWYIITPYISRPSSTSTSYDYNLMDSPAVYYTHSLGDGIYITGDLELQPLWTNKNIISGLINYLRTYEGRTEDVPVYNSGSAWTCVRHGGYNAWYVHLGGGGCVSNVTSLWLCVWPASAFG